MALGDILQELRKDAHLKQEDIAKLLGVTRATVGNYENGVAEPSINTLKILARFYSVSIDYLFEETQIKTPVASLLTQLNMCGQSNFENFILNLSSLSLDDQKVIFEITEALKIRTLSLQNNSK